MGFVHAVLALASATRGDLVRRPLYHFVLLGLALMIFLSQYVTLFSFYQEMNLVREMGMATITFFGFILIVLLAGVVVTDELEDRTAVTLLTKPISRAAFLLGKYLGLLGAVAPGVFILAGVLFVTLWFMAMPAVLGSDAFVMAAVGDDAFVAAVMEPASGGTAVSNRPWSARTSGAWGELPGMLELQWRFFVLSNGGVVLQGAFLSFLQIAVLGAFGISLAAFFPTVVSASATSLLFVLGNISSYMLAAVEKWQVGAASVAARVLYYLVPNLGYFNLQTFYSEGRIISVRYLGCAAAYALVYTVAVFLVSCAAFRRREIR